MLPEIKAQLEEAFIRAYNEAENSVERETIYWNAYDLNIVLTRETSQETKKIINDIHNTIKNILL